MPANPNSELLQGVRSLLLTFDDLTAVVSGRIRPDGPDTSDGNDPQVILQMPNGDQYNTLDRGFAFVNADIVIRIRTTTAALCDQLAEIIRSQKTQPSTGLDGYTGAAGSCTITSSERVSFGRGKFFDDDGDETDLFESTQVYSVWFMLEG